MTEEAPASAATASSAQSGVWAVSPESVVLRKRSWPQRSSIVMILAACSTISAPVGASGSDELSRRPPPSKPRTCCEMHEVAPDSISCMWRSTVIRAEPWPSSSAPVDSTPSSVDLPLCDAPMHATRTSAFAGSASACTRTSATSSFSPSGAGARRRCSTRIVASSDAHMRESVASDARISSASRPLRLPSSSTPIS